MHARIQSGFPFPIQIGLNGREWLARQMDTAHLRYGRQDNCFPWIEEWAQAQRLMDRHVRTPWPTHLDRLATALNPLHATIFRQYPVHDDWSTDQSEWAIDVVVRDAATLRRLYPRLVHHGLTTFASPDVLRFWGRRLPLSGEVPRRFTGEVVSDVKHREEGVRITHSVNGHSVKLYDKAFTRVGRVLRAEATMHNGADVRVYRPNEGDPEGPRAWRVLRRGIADLHRRAEVSRKAAERDLDALASIDDDTTLGELIQRVAQPTQWHRRRVRALLEAVSRGEFTLNGVRNRDLPRVFFSEPAPTPAEARRRSAWVSRRLRLLRAHGLLRKIAGTHRYHVTKAGRTITTAILTALRSTVRQLTPAA